MIYVLDTNSFRVLGHYFPERFPSFWSQFDGLVGEGRIISTREVYNELEYQARREHLREWIAANKHIFLVPSPEETNFVGQIFGVRHFQQLLNQKRVLNGGAAADPFVVALAKAHGGCVVTEEAKKKNAAKIPNVCEHFRVTCMNLEQMMLQEGWEF